MNWKWPQGQPEYAATRRVVDYATAPVRKESQFDKVEKSAVTTILQGRDPAIRGLAAEILLAKRDLSPASKDWGTAKIADALRQESGKALDYWRFVKRVFEGRNTQTPQP